MAHCIRLRGPWKIERPEASADEPKVRLIRQFGCSAGLKTALRVWLSIEAVDSPASVALNGNLLGKVASSTATADNFGAPCPVRFDVTTLLQPRNLLVIELSLQQPMAAEDETRRLGLVQLEVE